MDARNSPMKAARREINTGDMPLNQNPDIDLSLDANIVHGEELAAVTGDVNEKKDYLEKLAFMEEPVTILINENSRSDFPETHVPVTVQGRPAEVWVNGKWVPMGWMPINHVLVTKRKYVEVLARANPESFATVHDDANVERPRNTLRRSTRSSYPLSVIEDKNPRGAEWLSNILRGH